MTGWRVIGASVVGTLHAERGRGCEDAHAWATNLPGALIAIADGAGSRPRTSALGSHVAVATAIEAGREAAIFELLENDPVDGARRLAERAIAALEKEAHVQGLAVGALATTLCIGALTGDRVVVAQIGDGVAVVEHGDGRIETVANPDTFEYANEAVFLTSDGALDHLKVFVAEQVRSVALSTDGLRYKILDDLSSDQPFEPFFQDCWSYARTAEADPSEIEAFLREVDDQTGDDKTLLLAIGDYEGEPGDTSRLTARPEIETTGAARPE